MTRDCDGRVVCRSGVSNVALHTSTVLVYFFVPSPHAGLCVQTKSHVDHPLFFHLNMSSIPYCTIIFVILLFRVFMHVSSWPSQQQFITQECNTAVGQYSNQRDMQTRIKAMKAFLCINLLHRVHQFSSSACVHHSRPHHFMRIRQ
jgi:hypothetical protein